MTVDTIEIEVDSSQVDELKEKVTEARKEAERLVAALERAKELENEYQNKVGG